MNVTEWSFFVLHSPFFILHCSEPAGSLFEPVFLLDRRGLMIRRWLRGCLLPSALCLSAVGCTTPVESLTGGLVASWTPASKASDGGSAPPRSEELSAKEQIRLCLDTARAMDKAGNDEGALDQYERVLERDPSNYTAMRRLCVLYDHRGGKEDFKKAEELYRKVARARPNDADIWSDWGYSLYLRTDKENCKENWMEAEKKLRQALKLDPQHARAHANLGLVLGRLDRFDEALREFRAAQPSEADAHCNMAFVYWAKGRLDDARQECRIARDKDPSNLKARDLQAVLDQASHPHGETGRTAESRPDGRTPRASRLTPAQWEAEREAARRAVVIDGGPPPAPAGDKPPQWQASGPIVMPSGQAWMPVNAAVKPTAAVPSPAPVTNGVPATVEFNE